MALSAGTAIWAKLEPGRCGLPSRRLGDRRSIPDRTHDKLSAATELLLADIHAHRQVTVAQAAGLAAIFPLAFDDPYLKKAQLALSMIGAFLRTTGLNGVVSENGKNRTLSLS